MKKRYYFLIILIFMIPTIVGYLTNTDMHFSGLTHVTDGNPQLAMINQAKEGNLLFTNMFTSEDVPRVMLRPTYLIAGVVASLFHLPSIFVYHLFRILGILLFLFFLDKLVSLSFQNKTHKLVTIFICIFASGIGFFLKFLTLFGVKQYGSIDLWLTDANNFLLLMVHPHTIISLALMTASVYFFLKWFNGNRLKFLIFSSLFALLLGFIHLFDVITLCLTISFFMVDQFIVKRKIDWKRIFHLLIFVAIISIPVIYTFLQFTLVPGFASWNEQNVLDTPKLIRVIFGYGFMLFAVLAFLLYQLLRKKYHKITFANKFFIYWILSVGLLIYSPFNIQRRFLEGVHIPMGIITGVFLFDILWPKLRNIFNNRFYLVLIFSILFFLPMTNIYHLITDITHINNDRGSFPYSVNNYLYPEEHGALLWLKENIEEDSIIISTYNIGNHIVGYMNRRVYLGHWAQTIDLDKKAQDIEGYFKENKDISSDKVKYVWYGVDEMELNLNFKQPLNSEIVFMNEKVTIFVVK